VEDDGFLKNLLTPGPVYPDGKGMSWEISKREIQVFADLLRGLLRFSEWDRKDTNWALNHGYWKMKL